MPCTAELITLLQDSAFYNLHGLGQLCESLRLLETAEKLCAILADTDPPRARTLLIHVLSTMNPITEELGPDHRVETLERMSRVFRLLEEETGGVPPDQRTDEQAFLFARAQVDCGWYLLQLNKLAEADDMFAESIAYYSRKIGEGGDDDELARAFAVADRLYVLAVGAARKPDASERDRVRTEAAAALATIVRLNGATNHITLIFAFVVANVYFTVGDVDAALALWRETQAGRTEVLGSEEHSTLGTQYCVAVCLQNKGDLEYAEYVV